MEKEEAALTVTEHQPVWPRCTFHLRRGNGTHAKSKEIHTLQKILKYQNTQFKKYTFPNRDILTKVHIPPQEGQWHPCKFKEILTLRKILKCKNTRFDKNTFTNMPGVCVHHLRRGKSTNA